MSQTYPPTPHTSTVPPSPPTAFTGASNFLPVAAGAALGLALVGAVILRTVRRERRAT